MEETTIIDTVDDTTEIIDEPIIENTVSEDTTIEVTDGTSQDDTLDTEKVD